MVGGSLMLVWWSWSWARWWSKKQTQRGTVSDSQKSSEHWWQLVPVVGIASHSGLNSKSCSPLPSPLLAPLLASVKSKIFVNFTWNHTMKIINSRLCVSRLSLNHLLYYCHPCNNRHKRLRDATLLPIYDRMCPLQIALDYPWAQLNTPDWIHYYCQDYFQCVLWSVHSKS